MVVAEKGEGVPVRSGLGNKVRADDAAGARAIIDHHLLLERLREWLGEHAYNAVVR